VYSIATLMIIWDLAHGLWMDFYFGFERGELNGYRQASASS